MGPDSPFTGVSFNVIGGQIMVGNEMPEMFSGNIIPASLIENAKPGQNVAIEITYRRSGSTVNNVASCLLKVVP